MARANRKYKDSVFCDVFYSDRDAKANLLSLYNALHGTSYTDVGMIEKVRLEDVLYKDLKNDIAFLVGRQYIIMGEHQSTLNENMPLRSLLYIAREYESLVDSSDRYRSRRIMIARPEFFTFYNGTQDYPAEEVLQLSNSFPESEEEPQLELKVKVININPDKKSPLLANCQVMREYSQFVEETRKYKGDKDALRKAIEGCIKEGILADYLKRKGSEVVNMLMAEYDYDMDIAIQREEAAEEALARGRSEGLAQGRTEGILLMKKAQKLHEQGVSAAEIAKELKISIEQVHMMLP